MDSASHIVEHPCYLLHRCDSPGLFNSAQPDGLPTLYCKPEVSFQNRNRQMKRGRPRIGLRRFANVYSAKVLKPSLAFGSALSASWDDNWQPSSAVAWLSSPNKGIPWPLCCSDEPRSPASSPMSVASHGRSSRFSPTSLLLQQLFFPCCNCQQGVTF